LRIAAADALGKIGDARADEPLIDILMNPKLAPESLERKAVVKALLKSGRMTIEQIDEISEPFVAQYRADMEAIVEEYEAKVDKARANRPGIPYTKVPKAVESLYEKYKSESVEFLTKILFNSSSSDSEAIASCLALGKIATVQAREELGAIFSRQSHRHDGLLVSHSGDVCRIASQVLKRLGPPVPESLIEAIAAPHLYQDNEKRAIDRLLVAIGGSDLDERLTDFLKRHNSLENRSRIKQIKMELAIARREMHQDL
jgi:HEAT repeat protein